MSELPPEIKPTYGDSIECLVCRKRSYNLGDVENCYCGNCNRELKAGEFVLYVGGNQWFPMDLKESMSKRTLIPSGTYPILDRRPDRSMQLSIGFLDWETKERQTNRYGHVYTRIPLSVFVADTPEDTLVYAPIMIREKCHGTLFARVLEPGWTEHPGDEHLKIYPRMGEYGMEIPLGTGMLDYIQDLTMTPIFTQVGVRPDDKRSELWLDPRALYDVHGQLVELYFVPTTVV